MTYKHPRETTVTVPAETVRLSKFEHQVFINGTVSGSGESLADAKSNAVEALLELATLAQGSVSVVADVNNNLLVIRYPSGTGSGSINIRLDSVSGARVTCTGQGSREPTEAAWHHVECNAGTQLVYGIAKTF